MLEYESLSAMTFHPLLVFALSFIALWLSAQIGAFG